MSYAKPTLTELYTEIYLVPSTLKAGHMFDIVPRLKAVGFPEVEFRASLARVEPGEPGDQQITAQPRVRCWSADKTQLVQLGEDLVVVNLVGDYPGWDSFCRLVERGFGEVTEALNMPAVASVSLITIDKFEVALEGYTLGRYLACGGSIVPSWYSRSSEAIDITLGRGFLKTDRFNRQINVRVRIAKNVTVHLRATFHDTLKNGVNLADKLESLHDESNETFESMITDVTRSEVMGGLKP